MEPLVTIITTTSNIVDEDLSDDFTLQINLLDRQTYPNLEHLIIDNASTDGTDEILKEYKNAGYLNFFSERDNGKYDAYNKGLMRAKGKYVAFISCDDFYHDITAITDIVNLMEEDNADFCFFPSYCIHPEGYVYQFVPAIYNTFQVSPCPRQAVFFRKSALEELNGFDTKFKLIADYDLMVRLILNGYRGVYFENNVMTCKVGQQAINHQIQVEAESSHIYYKNYRSLYPITEEQIETIVKVSEIPAPLLEKLSQKFPPEDRDLFFERYNQILEIRKEAYRNNRKR